MVTNSEGSGGASGSEGGPGGANGAGKVSDYTPGLVAPILQIGGELVGAVLGDDGSSEKSARASVPDRRYPKPQPGPPGPPGPPRRS